MCMVGDNRGVHNAEFPVNHLKVPGPIFSTMNWTIVDQGEKAKMNFIWCSFHVCYTTVLSWEAEKGWKSRHLLSHCARRYSLWSRVGTPPTWLPLVAGILVQHGADHWPAAARPGPVQRHVLPRRHQHWRGVPQLHGHTRDSVRLRGPRPQVHSADHRQWQ